MTTDLDSRPAAPARRRWLRVHLGGAAAIALGLGLARSGRAADLPRFTLGVASGEPRPDGMVLWTRLMGENLPQRVPVRWEVAHDEAFQRPAAQGTEWAEAAWAHSVHAEPVGLEAGRPYWYRFTALGDRSPIGRTRTAPAPDAVATLNFAIASCQRLEHGHYAAWRDIVASDPDLILFLGDYLYEYGLITTRDPVRPVEGGRITTLEGYRARYAQYRADPLLQAAHAAAPWLVTWDDHEVENDYAGPVGGFPLEDFAARRAAATQAWWEHLPLPQAARPRGP
jgi:alkaline phosphatase D